MQGIEDCSVHLMYQPNITVQKSKSPKGLKRKNKKKKTEEEDEHKKETEGGHIEEEEHGANEKHEGQKMVT